jgi:hypothetical protein
MLGTNDRQSAIGKRETANGKGSLKFEARVFSGNRQSALIRAAQDSTLALMFASPLTTHYSPLTIHHSLFTTHH